MPPPTHTHSRAQRANSRRFELDAASCTTGEIGLPSTPMASSASSYLPRLVLLARVHRFTALYWQLLIGGFSLIAPLRLRNASSKRKRVSWCWNIESYNFVSSDYVRRNAHLAVFLDTRFQTSNFEQVFPNSLRFYSGGTRGKSSNFKSSNSFNSSFDH